MNESLVRENGLLIKQHMLHLLRLFERRYVRKAHEQSQIAKYSVSCTIWPDEDISMLFVRNES